MTAADVEDSGQRRLTVVLLTCGVVSGPLFVLAFLAEGAFRANYDSLRHPVSSLALGDLGWTQVTNFALAGLLTLAFAVGLHRALIEGGLRSTWGPLLVGVFALGLLGAGMFPTDPVSGYPPGSPAVAVDPTVHGRLHDLLSMLTFVGLPAACFVFARRFSGWGERRWSIFSAASGTAFVIGFILTTLGFSQAAGLVTIGGLLQRLTVAIGWLWLTLLALYLLRTRPAPSAD